MVPFYLSKLNNRNRPRMFSYDQNLYSMVGKGSILWQFINWWGLNNNQ
jgi:hypothetical protein